jgi:hypothetical protein
MLTEESSGDSDPKKPAPNSRQDPIAGAEQAVENEKAALESGEESPG